ncbi:hypothetical protein AAFF_G00436500 [Aldrovandia affinis]|uniref:Uncharacterized protein n=1 Tax=Aldrovandia affinis TaxID=143900 RepID=A0AAD7S7Y6_9TELE|nr:hypothetical protein AAFF_G00436500 [Aldrovandia affinis]
MSQQLQQHHPPTPHLMNKLQQQAKEPGQPWPGDEPPPSESRGHGQLHVKFKPRRLPAQHDFDTARCVPQSRSRRHDFVRPARGNRTQRSCGGDVSISGVRGGAALAFLPDGSDI